ncbi:MAG TPA: Ig-like domain repeat protein, partial [Acidimicrobiales bacterium]|nr:Ig-like domain repeat protein [Acidimicrobiales bacterium]
AEGEAVPNGETVKVTVGTATCTATLSGGKGTCSIGNSALAAGTYSVTASYGGDANLSASSATCSSKLTVKT